MKEQSRSSWRLAGLLLVLLTLSSCTNWEKVGREVESSWTETLSSVEGVTAVEVEFRKGGGVAGEFLDTRIYTDTNDYTEMQAVQYRAWEAIIPKIQEDGRNRLRWEVFSADRASTIYLNDLGFETNHGNDGIYKRYWEQEGVRERYDGPK